MRPSAMSTTITRTDSVPKSNPREYFAIAGEFYAMTSNIVLFGARARAADARRLLIQPPLGERVVHQRIDRAQLARVLVAVPGRGRPAALGQRGGIDRGAVAVREQEVRLRLALAVTRGDLVRVEVVHLDAVEDHGHLAGLLDLRDL